MDSSFNRRRIGSLVGLTIGFIVIIIIVALINIITKIGKIEVYIGYAPFVSEVTLNGEKIKNNAKHYLEQGEYVIHVECDGFESIDESVIVDDEIIGIFGSMIAKTDEAKILANKHMNDFLKIESYYGEEIQKAGEKSRKEWPIITRLPIKNSLYKIGYIIENNNITLTIETTESYMDAAVKNFLEHVGDVDNIAKYKIEYKEFVNRLDKYFVENSATTPEEYITNAFSGANNFQFVMGEEKEEYYIAVVTIGTEQTYSLVHYRMILKREGNKFKLASEPAPLLTKYIVDDDMPLDVINSANRLGF